jgi:transposase-like protein
MEAIENTAILKKNIKAHVEPPAPWPRVLKQSIGLRFTAVEAMEVFSAEFLSEHLCRMWILNKIHGAEPPRCPGCGEPVAHHLLRSFWENRRVRCGKCRKMFTALTGTFLSGCHMDFCSVYLLAVLLALGLPDKNIGRIVKMSSENVRLWRLKFKEIGE